MIVDTDLGEEEWEASDVPEVRPLRIPEPATPLQVPLPQPATPQPATWPAPRQGRPLYGEPPPQSLEEFVVQYDTRGCATLGLAWACP